MADSDRRIYLDNAATSFPKPPEVFEAMVCYGREIGASPGRGAYAESIEAGHQLNRCRDLIRQLINGESSDHVIFTLNASDALSTAIKGLAVHHRRRGESMHVVTTRLEHNSVLRPLSGLQADNVEHTAAPCDPETGIVDVADLEASIRPDTRMVAALHGSNVSGTLQPVEAIGELCRKHSLLFLCDAAQTLGHIPIDVQLLNIDLLAFPGHKGLLGPLGTGGLYIRPGVEDRMETLREGGTGSVSERPVQPTHLPDKYETGSHNAIGIIGLAEGVQWILNQGVDALRAHEVGLSRIVLEGLANIPEVKLLGPKDTKYRCGVFSITMDSYEPTELAAIFEDQFGLLTRPGLHCAPLAHETFGTYEKGGAVRLSFGPFNTEDDAHFVIDAIGQVCRSTSKVGSA